MRMHKSKAVAFLCSAVLTISIIGSLTVLHELDSPLKAFLNSVTGNHWVTKSVFAAILFPLFSAILYFVLDFEKARRTLKAEDLWAWSLLLTAITIIFFLASLIFYIVHYFSL